MKSPEEILIEIDIRILAKETEILEWKKKPPGPVRDTFLIYQRACIDELEDFRDWIEEVEG